MKKLSEREERELIKKIEKKRSESFSSKKEMYIKQTDRNYKDGDRN
jgi:hypothetical protein